MSDRHIILCGGVRAPTLGSDWKGAPVRTLRLGRERHDVHLRLTHLTDRMCARLPSVAVDLVELAAYVYAADQATTRGGPTEFEYGSRWRRHFHFQVPVRCPDVWRRPAVTNALANTLGFLSDDDYEFAFVRHTNPPPLANYLFDGLDDAEEFDEVVLFSGGLDSLAGAVREVLQGHHKVALVSHRPSSKVYARQCELVARITDLVPQTRLRPLHVAVEVNKGKGLGREFSQRARSFLFAAVAAVVARGFGLPRLRFYENGGVSLNLPVSPQVLGGRASRTTHPRVLAGFEVLLSEVFGEPFAVQNPFLWQTKGEVIGGIKTAGHGNLCALTCSCVHTWEQTADRPHCGRCSQCLDRRLAALAAKLDDCEDPVGRYRVDPLAAPMAGADLILAERYVGMLLQVEQVSNAAAFLARFPETVRALRHVGEPAARAADLAHELYRRHAQAVRAGLAEAVRREPECVVLRSWPVGSLLGIVSGRPVGPAPVVPPAAVAVSAADRRLVLDPERFEARLRGRPCFLGNTFEYRLLARLIQRPGLFLSIDALRASVWCDEHTSKNTIQRTVCNLRRRLADAGFIGLQIDGSQRDHYCLILPD
jgi:hypothetical protein